MRGASLWGAKRGGSGRGRRPSRGGRGCATVVNSGRGGGGGGQGVWFRPFGGGEGAREGGGDMAIKSIALSPCRLVSPPPARSGAVSYRPMRRKVFTLAAGAAHARRRAWRT